MLIEDALVGEICFLKSGSPQMTIRGVTAEGLIQCVWFADGHVGRGDFLPECLTKHYPGNGYELRHRH